MSLRRGHYTVQRGLQSFRPYRRFELPGDNRRASRQCLDDLADVLSLMMLAGHEDRIMHGQRRKALVDDPSERLDLGPHKILLQPGRLVDRGGLGQRNDQHAGKRAVAEPGEQPVDGCGKRGRLPRQFSMVGQGRVQ